MPLYAWKGIDILGIDQRGTAHAETEQELQSYLFSQGIALTRARITRFWLYRVTKADLLYLMQSLVTLLKGGVSLSQALKLLKVQAKNPAMSALLCGIARDIDRGISIREAFEKQPNISDLFLLQLIEAGEASGKLAETCTAWTVYTEEVELLKTDIRKSLMMPLLTFGVFCTIATVLIVVMVPLFASLLQSAGQDIPQQMQILLGVRDILTGWAMIIVMACLVLLTISYSKIRLIPSIAYWIDWMGLRIPYINFFIQKMQHLYVLQIVGMLTSAGIALVPALQLAQRGLKHAIFKERLSSIIAAVSRGIPFSDATRHYIFFSHDIDAFIDIGQESGALGAMILRAAEYTRKQFLRRLDFVARYAQPIILIILGFLIGMLIIMVYVPIVSISYAII
jgi:type IV pilus assembly protein PilC